VQFEIFTSNFHTNVTYVKGLDLKRVVIIHNMAYNEQRIWLEDKNKVPGGCQHKCSSLAQFLVFVPFLSCLILWDSSLRWV